MTTVAESQGEQRTIRSTLSAGIEALSVGERFTFTKYVRKILPVDGYAFWLAGETIELSGSLHYSISRAQNEDETSSINSVVFNTTTEIQDLNRTNPQTIYIATVNGIRFAFARRGPFFTQAGIYHYEGEAVYGALSSQLVSNLYDLQALEPIVSNSLPAWLSLQTYSPFYLVTPNPGITLFPSFLVPANLTPPYGAIHIEPAGTRALQAAPKITQNRTHYQLAADRVKITLYGLSNAQALDFVDMVNEYTLNTDTFGLMGSPIIKDEKRTQPELQVIAMKKTIEYEVSYYQSRMNDVARQLITECTLQFGFAT